MKNVFNFKDDSLTCKTEDKDFSKNPDYGL